VGDIRSFTRTLRQIAERPYALGAYQRDYEWDEEHAAALFQDLRAAFSNRVSKDDASNYFLGPIVTREGAPPKLVDGQQRLTTLNLLAIAIRRAAKLRNVVASEADGEEAESVARGEIKLRDPLFSAAKFAQPAQPHVLEEQRRLQVFAELEADGQLRDVSTDMMRRLHDNFALIARMLETELAREELNDFLGWIADHVVFAEIRIGGAQSDFAVFDAMNSRGKPLEPLSQFMTFFSARIAEAALRDESQKEYAAVRELIARHGKRQDIEFVRSWAMARALNLGEATPETGEMARKRLADSEAPKINQQTIFFVRDHADSRPEFGLQASSSFVQDHWRVFGHAYDRIKNGYKAFDPQLDSLWFIAKTRFEQSLDCFDEVAMLAACAPGGDDQVPRLAQAARFLECVSARDSWCRLSATPAKKQQRHPDRLRYIIARAGARARGKTLGEQAKVFAHGLTELGFDFSDVSDPSWRGGDSKHARMILAGLTLFLDRLAGNAGDLRNLVLTRGKDSQDIEHFIPANRAPGAENGHNFRNDTSYHRNRNRLALLVLLPSNLNQVLSDRPVPVKRNFYASNPCNALAKTIFGSASMHGLLGDFLRANSVDFPNVPSWTEAIAQQRQKALVKLAGLTWGPDKIAAKPNTSV
jgi:hypothetical protein